MIASGRAAILAYTMPVLAVPLSVWLLGERLTSRKIAGLVLGLGGLALLLGEAVGRSRRLAARLAARARRGVHLGARRRPAEALSGFDAHLAVHRLDHAARRRAGHSSARSLFEDWRVLGNAGQRAWLGVAYNVFIAFAWAHWAWIKIATSVSVTVFSLSMLVIPVVGVLSGMLFLGERPSIAEVRRRGAGAGVARYGGAAAARRAGMSAGFQ